MNMQHMLYRYAGMGEWVMKKPGFILAVTYKDAKDGHI